MNESISNEDQHNSLVTYEEFEKSIFCMHNSTVIMDKPETPIEVASEIRKTTPDIETKQPEKLDNRDRFMNIRLFTKPETNADSYLKSSLAENLNTRNGFQKLKTDINAGRSSSTQSLDKTASGLTKTSMLRDRIAAVSKNVKPNTVQNVIPKSPPVSNSRQNVNKLSGLVRPSSGFYSFNTDIDKFELANNVQSVGDSSFVSNANNEPPIEPKLRPSRIAKPWKIAKPSKKSRLPRPMSKQY